MSSDLHDFPQFRRLPYDIRRLIWECCLPRRVVEEDQLHAGEGLESTQACEAWKSPRRTQIRPCVARVCKEARAVAESWGQQQHFNEQVDPDADIWIQPRLDTLHLNWTRFRFIDMGCHDACSPLDMFLIEAAELGVPASILGYTLHPFDAQDDGVATILWPLPGEVVHVKDGNQEVSAVHNWITHGSRIDTVVASLSFHITSQEARRSGLFGLLGDAPVQTISCDDADRLQKFAELFRTLHVAHSDTGAAEQMELLLSDPFQRRVALWKSLADWVMLAQMWQQDMSDGKLGRDEAGAVWHSTKPTTTITPGDIIYREDYAFDQAHWWVRQAKEAMPRLRPMIMFRHCLHDCHLKK